MTLEEMRTRKREMGLSNEMIAERSAVPLGTVQKIFAGVTKAPRYGTLRALESAFGLQNREDTGNPASGSKNVGSSIQDMGGASEKKPANAGYLGNLPEEETSSKMVRESASYYSTDGNTARGDQYSTKEGHSLTELNTQGITDDKYPRQGTYTLKDYLALPDDQRVELIDGVFYDMASPASVHQMICDWLIFDFMSYIENNGGPCVAVSSPIDVQLDEDDKTIVEPDVCIVCDTSKIHYERIYGAPDLAVEVLSRSTRKKDQTLKVWKYSRAGVREYWIIDPDQQKINVFDLEGNTGITTYSFHDKVPVGIYGGKLVIDFEKIWNRIRLFYPAEPGKVGK